MEQLNQAIAEVKAGNKGKAKQLLTEIVRTDPQNEMAWLWLSVCVDSIEQKNIACLRRFPSI
jgi:Tfp pilus assembly protein PilF